MKHQEHNTIKWYITVLDTHPSVFISKHRPPVWKAIIMAVIQYIFNLCDMTNWSDDETVEKIGEVNGWAAGKRA